MNKYHQTNNSSKVEVTNTVVPLETVINCIKGPKKSYVI